MTELRGDELLEEVRRALKAEGCCAEVEIVRLLGARPGQRNWEIATIGSNTPPPDVRRCIGDVQTRLGEQFQTATAPMRSATVFCRSKVVVPAGFQRAAQKYFGRRCRLWRLSIVF